MLYAEVRHHVPCPGDPRTAAGDTPNVFATRWTRVSRSPPRGHTREAVSRALDGIAYPWVEVLGHPGRPLAPVIGVHPQAVYQAVARGREARSAWERLLRSSLVILGNVI